MSEGQEVPPVGDAAQPAFVLEPGMPYVTGWAEADVAAGVLRRELAACGLAERVPLVRAEVTAAGVGVVELGRVTLATARVLAGLLAAARTGPAGQAGPDDQPAQGPGFARPCSRAA